MTKSIVIYSRCSTDKESADTTEEQLWELNQWAQNNGYDVVGAFKDLQSGRTMESRQGLLSALLLAGEMGCPIAVVELTRLSRSIADTSALISSGQSFIFTRQGREMSKEMILFASLLGEMESDSISKRVSAGIQRAFELDPERRRTWGGGRNPAESSARMTAGRKAKADQFARVNGAVAFEMNQNGTSMRNIAMMFERLSIKTPRGKSCWSVAQVHSLIKRYKTLADETGAS